MRSFEVARWAGTVCWWKSLAMRRGLVRSLDWSELSFQVDSKYIARVQCEQFSSTERKKPTDWRWFRTGSVGMDLKKTQWGSSLRRNLSWIDTLNRTSQQWCLLILSHFGMLNPRHKQDSEAPLWPEPLPPHQRTDAHHLRKHQQKQGPYKPNCPILSHVDMAKYSAIVPWTSKHVERSIVNEVLLNHPF